MEYTRGGKRVKERKKRNELLGLNNARRTPKTIPFKYEISLEEIMFITGHRSSKSLKKYIKVTDKDILKNVLKRVQERDKLTKITPQKG